jgi:ubiquinone/menaquinone biosynthesis C-methylase UbiE
MSASTPLMFHRLARYYDDLVAAKDYRSEARFLAAIVRRVGRSRGRAWLDVACGTGNHLSFLRRRYTVTGLDISREMLRVARRRLPGVRLVRGDMRDFRLGESFDVVSCLFSAIGHLRSERELAQTFANFARHLKPGGVAIVEPWIDPADFHVGHVHLVTNRGPSVTVARMSISSRRGRRSSIHYHYLIGETGRRLEHFEEVDLGLLVPRDRLLQLMEAAGLAARFQAEGFMPDRGLLVGVKPLIAPGTPERSGEIARVR